MNAPLSRSRRWQLTATRNRLNRQGDAYGDTVLCRDDLAFDTVPGNASAQNRKRIRVRNKINARLRDAAQSPPRLAPGTRVTYGRWPGVIVRHEFDGLYIVALPGGQACIGASALAVL